MSYSIIKCNGLPLISSSSMVTRVVPELKLPLKYLKDPPSTYVSALSHWLNCAPSAIQIDTDFIVETKTWH